MKFVSRDKEILRISEGKNVLHLGCVGFADLTKEERLRYLPNTLHAKLYNVSRNIVGLDYSKEVIDEIKELDAFNNVHYADAENLFEVKLDQKFEVIVIGDLIEHLANPGRMLDGVKLFCDKDTIIIFTTPNAFGIASFIRYLFNTFKEGNEHVMTFNKFNFANLLKRFNYKVVEINMCYQENATKSFLFKPLSFLLRLFPKFGGTLFVVAKIN